MNCSKGTEVDERIEMVDSIRNKKTAKSNGPIPKIIVTKPNEIDTNEATCSVCGNEIISDKDNKSDMGSKTNLFKPPKETSTPKLVRFSKTDDIVSDSSSSTDCELNLDEKPDTLLVSKPKTSKRYDKRSISPIPKVKVNIKKANIKGKKK